MVRPPSVVVSRAAPEPDAAPGAGPGDAQAGAGTPGEVGPVVEWRGRGPRAAAVRRREDRGAGGAETGQHPAAAGVGEVRSPPLVRGDRSRPPLPRRPAV